MTKAKGIEDRSTSCQRSGIGEVLAGAAAVDRGAAWEERHDCEEEADMTDTTPTKFLRLLSSFEIGNATLANRIVFQPHFTALLGTDGMPNETLHAYLVERALGGVGLIVDGHMTIMAEGMMSPHYIRAWEEDFVPAYASMVDDIHAHGTRIFGQITHSGHTSLTEPPQVLWAPTQMPEPSSRYTTRAMDRADIRRTITGFGVASANIMRTGADGIEVKIAHDGLLRSFASPYFNQRTDAYGGDFERRMRLPLEVLGSIREAVGPGTPLGVRLCLHEYTPFGYELDYGLRMAERFEASGLVDYFNCDAGTFSSFWMEIPPAAVDQGFFRPLNQALKAQSDLPVIAFGRVKTPEMAEQMLELGEADLIGMARPLIADAEIPAKLAEGRAAEIRSCIGCNDACIHQVVQTKPIRCIQNPAAGQERIYSDRLLQRAQLRRKVVVVGAGPAGLKVAEIAARRGHTITLYERLEQMGGQVRLAARQPKHQEVQEVTAYLEGAVARLGVDVHLGVEADVETLLGGDGEVLIIATGSQPDVPVERLPAWDHDAGSIARSRGLQVRNALPGLELPVVQSADTVLGDPPASGSRVLVIDAQGHWEAAGTAEFLSDQGCSVEVLTRRSEVGFGLEATNRVMFHQRARAKGIKLMPNLRTIAITNDGVQARSVLDGAVHEFAGFDVVVPVYPRASRDDLYFELEQQVSEDVTVLRVGDASAPRMIQNVILEAQQIAMQI